MQCIIEFSQQFDPTETLMIIANDPERREFIHSAPDTLVPLSYITTDLWPKLGFLPIDPENPGVALIAEFMLNELVLKNSESLQKLNLQHLKELFSGEGDEEEDEDQEVEEDNEEAEMSPPQQKEKKSDNYSESGSDDNDFRAMDIGALRKQQASEEAAGKNKSKQGQQKEDSDDGYGEDEFN